jgi:hypothetical protein
MSVGRDLRASDDALVGRPSDRDRSPRHEPADPSGASRMGEGGKPLAIGLVSSLTREIEGKEDVLGLHGGLLRGRRHEPAMSE